MLLLQLGQMVAAPVDGPPVAAAPWLPTADAPTSLVVVFGAPDPVNRFIIHLF